MQLAALGAVALVDEDEQLAHRWAGLRGQLRDEGFEVIHIPASELVHQRAQQTRRGLPQLLHQVAPAAGALDRFAGFVEDTLDLFVQFVAVGDDQHPRVRLVLQNPLGQQHHHDALAAALGVPEDAALVGVDVRLRGLESEILVHARQLLLAAVEQDEIVHQFDQAGFIAELQQILVEFVAAVIGLIFLPIKEVFFLSLDCAVLQPFRIVACKHELHRAEEPCIELGLLVRQILTNAVADGRAAVFQFDHADGDAVDVQHQIGPPLVAVQSVAQGDFLGNRKIVAPRLRPIDQLDGFSDFARLHLHRHAVAQQAVDRLIVVVEAAVGVVRFGAQQMQGTADLLRRIARFGQVNSERIFFDVAVAVALGPIAERAVAQLVAEQREDTVLGGAFRLADAVHVMPVKV